MQIKVRMWLNLEVDPEDYIIPSDGDITEELEDGIREYIHDINGVQIKTMRVTQEIKDEQRL